MQYTRQQIIKTLLAMYKEDQKTLDHKILVDKYSQLHVKTGVNVFSYINKGKSNNRFDINVLGGHSGGGRLGSQYKSGHKV